MKGLIFIPDITGFTNFVNSIDIDLGVSITSDLLNEIIDKNSLNMELSEIEGDAVLFYKLGKPIPLKQILCEFRNIYQAFDLKYQQWKFQYKLQADLSLKLIVHYGDIIVYDIKGFQKLYGEAVIESHRLLKNGSAGSHYILVTEEYINALQQDVSELLMNEPDFTSYKSQLSGGAKNIAYYFFSTIKKASALSDMPAAKEVSMQDDLYVAVGT